MIIGSILENQNIEKRIAITPEIVKKYVSSGLEVYLHENYGVHLGINNKEFSDAGAKISAPSFCAISIPLCGLLGLELRIL